MGVFAETAREIGGFDNKYLLFYRFLDVEGLQVPARSEGRAGTGFRPGAPRLVRPVSTASSGPRRRAR